MRKIKVFFLTTLLGGVIVILPVAVLIVVVSWVFNFISNLIQPITNVLLEQSGMSETVAVALAISIILGLCFFIGLLVKTSIGKFFHVFFERHILKLVPGYNLIKETIIQLLGGKKSPFSTVALARAFGGEALVTVFVTDEHPDGACTVFMPTGPNPTSGMIFHLKADCVFPVDVPVESAMRSIISCGAGSTALIEDFKKKYK